MCGYETDISSYVTLARGAHWTRALWTGDTATEMECHFCSGAANIVLTLP